MARSHANIRHVVHGVAAAEQEGVHADGDNIRIVEKEYWDILDPCGACDGRQMAHVLRLTPSGVSDEGTVSLTSESKR